MKERQYLRKSKLIRLCEESDGDAKRTFRILKKLSEGASSICYEADHGEKYIGVLKEFYPQGSYGLKRNKDGQLINSLEFKDAFLKAKEEYIEPYKMLLEAKRSNAGQDLSTFIPNFEIYHGCDADGSAIGTIYIWTPESKRETFDHICDEIHKHPDNKPEHKIVTVLNAIESLTKCICALHSADMIHRDIKPSNFGFMNRRNQTLTQTISLFDINSICSVYRDSYDAVGTYGFIEPEAGYEPASNQTDIFSIGATLFNALIVTDETEKEGYLFKSEYYERLREMIDESKLIQASEANSHPRLRNILVKILQKCLCERTYRYENCEDLLCDLEKALYYALPTEFAKKYRAGEQWILKDVEKSLDINKGKNSFLAIQHHLYAHPLYQCSKESDDINVLVIGFGNYGQKFLDACLQNGQILNKQLCVTVVSDDKTDKEIYLSERPELKDFFNIDGSITDGRDTYGDLTFEIAELKRDDQSNIAEVLQNIMYKHYDSKIPHYIFIALGDDDLNITASNACRIASEVLEIDCVISYICENRSMANTSSHVLCPLCVNDDIKASHLYDEIERMAFNTHLVWKKDLNVDYNAIRSEFEKHYNHDSCVSSVLALKYKLYSMGINLEKIGFGEAARLFREMINDKSNRLLKNELIWIEHRRWVTEKLCRGWRRIENLDECAGGITKDEKNKRHVCIVRSRPDQKLAEEYSSDMSYWDNAQVKDLDQLDELDRMSVELHRMFTKEAEKAKKQNLLDDNSIIAGIRSLIEENKKAITAFHEWFTCLKNIWNGDREKIHLYESLKDSFLKEVDGLSNEKFISERVKAFETVFCPVHKSMEYRDWKKDDVSFIDNIPFVLTYTKDAYLVIPFSTGKNGEPRVFENVSSATIVNPMRILYLYSVRKEQDVQDLRDSIRSVVAYMEKKHLKSAVEFIIVFHKSMHFVVNSKVAEEIRYIGCGVKLIQLTGLGNGKEIAQEFESYLKRRSAGKKFFAVEKNAARLSSLLEGAGFYNSFASYEFDSAKMSFNSISDCDMLGYIKKTPYITVADMITLSQSLIESINNPEFFDDYKELWEKYTEGRGLWKFLCNILGAYAEDKDKLVSFRKKDTKYKNNYSEVFRYIIPFVCIDNVENIIKYLEENGIVEQGCRVNGYTTESCEVVIVDRCGYRSLYDKLFSNIYALMIPGAITPIAKSCEVSIMFDDLVVKEVNLENRISEIRTLMEFFKKKGYIRNFSITDGRMSFIYANRQIKKLLNTAGRILEVYTYHKIKEFGKFDDVVSDFEINLRGKNVKNEFDFILTKGFRTLFVECKARPSIEQDFYFKLASLAEQFEINSTTVLIADTQEKSSCDDVSPNAIQRRRGSMMDVVTIWKNDEINNIGHTLFKVINGKYASEEDGENV